MQWVFLNSSISEGLPLALGEAALTGAPVVCTDVGASRQVLTDPSDGSCYSEVVAPNDALALARAQIRILAMLDKWEEFSDPTASTLNTRDASFPDQPTAEDITRITKRMYEQGPSRQALGMRTRAIVQKSFSGDRYLREHEQMLWIGKAKRDMSLPQELRPSARLTSPAAVKLTDVTRTSVHAPRMSLKVEEESQRLSASIRQFSLPSLMFDYESKIPASIISTIPTSLVTECVPSSIKGQVVNSGTNGVTMAGGLGGLSMSFQSQTQMLSE